jgi:ribosomal protein S14
MKKRQDFEEVKIVPKKEKPKKEKLRCDICGKIIKKGTLCYECQKAGW